MVAYCVLSVHFVSESVAHKHPKAKEKGVSESVYDGFAKKSLTTDIIKLDTYYRI